MQLDYNKIFINTEIEDFGEIFSEPFIEAISKDLLKASIKA